MKFTIVLTVCVALVQGAPLIANSVHTQAVPNSYIVVLKDGQSMSTFQNSFDNMARRQNAGPGGVKTEMIKQYDSFPGFHAQLAPAALKELQSNPEVEYIEQDAIMSINAQQTKPPSWGLTRVSQKALNLRLPFLYNDKAGAGITAYVIDTGVFAGHSDFGGRAKLAKNFVTGSPDEDENGHGTHVSGTIGGTKYGVAKKVNIVGVKVLGGDGSGSTSGVVAGMDWVAANGVKGKSVVNMSLGGGQSKTIDAAAGRLFAANIPLIAAAGNDETQDACAGSPSGAKNVYTVGASDRTDTVAEFSSPGKCVEIFAPGVDITSAWIGSANAKNTISGTSMATPHVVGVAALYLSQGQFANSQALFDKLTSTSTAGAVKGNLGGSPNKLVFNGGVGSVPAPPVPTPTL